MIETIASIRYGEAPFPTEGMRIVDDWSDEPGRVVYSRYPFYVVQWDDGSISTERVEY